MPKQKEGFVILAADELGNSDLACYNWDRRYKASKSFRRSGPDPAHPYAKQHSRTAHHYILGYRHISNVAFSEHLMKDPESIDAHFDPVFYYSALFTPSLLST
jgi:hypothetical protein